MIVFSQKRLVLESVLLTLKSRVHLLKNLDFLLSLDPHFLEPVCHPFARLSVRGEGRLQLDSESFELVTFGFVEP